MDGIEIEGSVEAVSFIAGEASVFASVAELGVMQLWDARANVTANAIASFTAGDNAYSLACSHDGHTVALGTAHCEQRYWSRTMDLIADWSSVGCRY
jgi:hypothetical protein